MNGISRYFLRSIDTPNAISGHKRTEIDSLQKNIFQGGSSSKKLKQEEKWGSKHANLLIMEEGLNLPGVIVPHPWGISSQAVANLLNEHGGIQTAWSALNRLYQQNGSQRFLCRPDVKRHLDAIARTIATAFKEADLEELAGPEFAGWLSACPGYLMVRSTGAEDNRRTANAGGNISRAYVSPTPAAFCSAACDVITSYFQTASLQNQINAGINPFDARPQLSVTAQELIGETDDEIPISLVLFTNEPLYVNNENFRIMRISAAYGHGEGVVKGAGVATDTILIASAPDSEGLYTLYDNAGKGKRLASKGLVDNPPELQKKRTLDDSMIARLHALGLAAEKLFGNAPTDMEIVIKGDKIYPVQARPINRIASLPTYLNTKEVKKTVRGEVLVPGSVVVAKAQELLCTSTLAQAEKVYDPALHKAVIVSHPEPANSHPIVNFSSLGVPCLLVKEKLDLEGLVVLCMQEGTVNLWDPAKGDVKNFIAHGYTVHPAKIGLSFKNQISARTYGRKMKVPEEVKELLLLLRSDKTQKTALQKLQSHPFVVSLSEEREKLKKITKYRQVVETVNVLDELSELINRAFCEVQKSFKTETRLLFHCKVLSTLLLNSRIAIAPYIADAQELTDCHPDLYLAGNAAFEPSTREKWRAMLQKLDPAKVPRLRSIIRTLEECGVLSAWFAFFFKAGEIDLSPQDEERLKQLRNLSTQVNALQADIALFGHPSTWERGNQRLQEIANINLMKLFTYGSPLAKQAALQVIVEIVNLYDLCIKQMKGSSEWPTNRKKCMFKRMNCAYFSLLERWCNLLDLKEKTLERKLSIRTYLQELKEKLHSVNPLEDDLMPSPFFSVAAAAIDSTALLNRHMPSKLEDHFTLTHQNLLALISSLNPCLIEGSALPSALVSQIKYIEGYRMGYSHNRVSMAISPDRVEVKYNIPLSAHSAQMVLRYDHESGQSTIQTLFLGEGRDRWSRIAAHAQVLDRYGIITLAAPVYLNCKEVIVTWKVGSDLPKIMPEIADFCKVSFGDRVDIDRLRYSYGLSHKEYATYYDNIDSPCNLKIWSCYNFTKAEQLIYKKNVAVCEYAARGIVDNDPGIRDAAAELFSKLFEHEQGFSQAAVAMLAAIKSNDSAIRATGCKVAQKLADRGEALEEVYTVAVSQKSLPLMRTLLKQGFKCEELAQDFKELFSLDDLYLFVNSGYACDLAFEKAKAHYKKQKTLALKIFKKLLNLGKKIEEVVSLVRPFEVINLDLVIELVQQGKMLQEAHKLVWREDQQWFEEKDLHQALIEKGQGIALYTKRAVSLQDVELFELLVSNGHAQSEAIEAARKIIDTHKGIRLLNCVVEEGTHCAEVLKVIVELFEGERRFTLIKTLKKIVRAGVGFQEAIEIANQAVNSRSPHLRADGVELFELLHAQGQKCDMSHLDFFSEPELIEHDWGIENMIERAKNDFSLRGFCLTTLLKQGLYDQAQALGKKWAAGDLELFLIMIKEKLLIPEAIKRAFFENYFHKPRRNLIEALFSIGEGFEQALSILPPETNQVPQNLIPLVLLLVKHGKALAYGAFLFEQKMVDSRNSDWPDSELLTVLVNHGLAFKPALELLIKEYLKPWDLGEEEEKLEEALLKQGRHFFDQMTISLLQYNCNCSPLLRKIFALGGGIEAACQYAEKNLYWSDGKRVYQMLFDSNQGLSAALQFAEKDFEESGKTDLFQLLFINGKGFAEALKAAEEGMKGNRKGEALSLFWHLALEGQGWNQALEAVKKGLRIQQHRPSALSLLTFLVKQGLGYTEAIACLEDDSTPIQLAKELKWQGQAVKKAEAFIAKNSAKVKDK